MKKNEELLCAGNLFEEMQEINKLTSENEYVEIPGTNTTTCAAFLSLYCC